MKKDYLSIPNIVTSMRFFGALIILFLKPFSLVFYIIYLIAGFSDCIDGFLARKMNKVTAFGSKLDSICDLTFYTILLIKIVPTIKNRFSDMVWFFILIIIISRLMIYIYTAIKYKELLSNHTILNKLTGVFVYLLPLFINTIFEKKYCYMLILVALFALIQEFFIIIKKTKI